MIMNYIRYAISYKHANISHTLTLFIFLLANGATNAGTLVDFTPAEQQWMRDNPVIKYAIDPYWPIEYMEGNEHKGLTRDYIDQISHITGLRFQLVHTNNFAEAKQLAAQGNIDLIPAINHNLLNINQYRGLLLSRDYFSSSTAVITRSGEEVVFSPEKLNGKLVEVKRNGAIEYYLREHYPEILLTSRDDPTAALEDLSNEKIDAVVGLYTVLQPIVTRKYLGTLHVAGILSELPVTNAMGISQNSPELQSIINKSLSSITSDLSSLILDRWLANTEYGAPSWEIIFAYYAQEISLLTISIIIIVSLALLSRRAQIAAQQSEAAKSAFLAMMSHEVRSPMNGIISSIELLKQTPLTTDQNELTTLASTSATALLELVDDVLDISKLEARMLSVESVPTNLNIVLHSLIDIYTVGASSNNTSLTLNIKGLNNILVSVDPVRFRQIISNLLSNAVKFTKDGTVELYAVFEIIAPTTGFLKIQVIDTGIGIDLEKQSRLFQAFVQADNSITRRYGGSGLGLSICKQLLELMNGQIQLESTLGKGTKVSCTLPLTFQNNTPDTQQLESALSAKKNTNDDAKLILVVEDNPVNQRTIALQLSELGFQHLIVESGMKALTLIEKKRNTIAMLLLDCHLPDMDGYEVSKKIRIMEKLKNFVHLPIIAISATTNEAHIIKSIESGIDGNLPKPLDLSSLTKTIGIWLATEKTHDNPYKPSIQEHSLYSLFVITMSQDITSLRESLKCNNLELAAYYSHRIYGSALTSKIDALINITKHMDNLIHKHENINNAIWLNLNDIEEAIHKL